MSNKATVRIKATSDSEGRLFIRAFTKHIPMGTEIDVGKASKEHQTLYSFMALIGDVVDKTNHPEKYRAKSVGTPGNEKKILTKKKKSFLQKFFG